MTRPGELEFLKARWSFCTYRHAQLRARALHDSPAGKFLYEQAQKDWGRIYEAEQGDLFRAMGYFQTRD